MERPLPTKKRIQTCKNVNLRVFLIRWHSICSNQAFSQTNLSCVTNHTIYTRNNMGHKCEGNCGLWVLHEMIKKTYPENLKKIVGAVWELPAK